MAVKVAFDGRSRVYRLLRAWKYDLFASVFFVLFRLFYRQVEIWGEDDSSQEDALIFVAGPHSNDVADTGLLMPFILTRFGRRVSFLVGARTMGKPVEGFLARGVGATVLNREWDNATLGTGTICISLASSGRVIRGCGTRFDLEARPGDRLMCVVAKKHILRGTVAEICGPEMLLLTQPLRLPENPGCLEALDSDRLANLRYSWVTGASSRAHWDEIMTALRTNGAISLFPEGTCHDQPHLLPFKSGFAVIALKYAAAAFPHQRVRIVPCAIHHQQSHLFRSKIGLEFGSPITIPSELITAFKAGKEKLAVSALRRLVQSVLSEMTLLDSDSDDMIPKVIKAFTTLSPPPSIQETLQRKRHIVRRLRADIKVQSLDTCQNLTTRINQFNKELASFGIKSLPVSGHATTLLLTLMKNILLLSLTTPLVAPGLLLFTPLLLASGYFARRHAARATATSAFRIRGQDVLASAKALYAVQMAPVLYGAFAWGISIVYSWGSFAGFGKPVIVVMGLVLVTVLGIVALPAGNVVMDAVAEVRDVVACLREAVWSEEGRVKMGRLVKMKVKLESEVERFLGEYEGEEGCMGDKPLF